MGTLRGRCAQALRDLPGTLRHRPLYEVALRATKWAISEEVILCADRSSRSFYE